MQDYFAKHFLLCEGYSCILFLSVLEGFLKLLTTKISILLLAFQSENTWAIVVFLT